MYCQYYQAHIVRSKAWFISGIFRNEENIAFVRAVDSQQGVFEFFVPQGFEQDFLKYMNYLLSHGYVSSFEKKANRIEGEHALKP